MNILLNQIYSNLIVNNFRKLVNLCIESKVILIGDSGLVSRLGIVVNYRNARYNIFLISLYPNY